jgi:heme iron utilization protein
MQNVASSGLKSLLYEQSVGALATLHNGEPAVSMVPFALLPHGDLIIHVSSLASHTQDMRSNSSVAVLITALLAPDLTPLALPRVSINGTAKPCPVDAPIYTQARDSYLARFSDAEELFGFSDFSLFTISANSIRYVAGFGRATTLNPEQLRAALQSI